jgi:hypothetical protein
MYSEARVNTPHRLIGDSTIDAASMLHRRFFKAEQQFRENPRN